MTRTLTALAAAASFAVAAIATPTAADARGGRIAAGVIGGLAAGAIIGGALGLWRSILRGVPLPLSVPLAPTTRLGRVRLGDPARPGLLLIPT